MDIIKEAFFDELKKIAFMKTEDIEDDILGTHIDDKLLDLARELIEKEKEKSFALRHPAITGIPTLGMWPLIKEQYALRRIGRNLVRKSPEMAERAHRETVERDEANRFTNAAGAAGQAYILGKLLEN